MVEDRVPDRSRLAGPLLVVWSLSGVYGAGIVVRADHLAALVVYALAGAGFVLCGVREPAWQGSPGWRPLALGAAGLLGGALLWRGDPLLGGVTMALGVALLFGLRSQAARAAALPLAFLTVARLLQRGVGYPLELASASGHAVDGAGRLVAWLLRACGQECEHAAGRIHLNLMPGLMSVGVTLERLEVFAFIDVLVALLLYDLWIARSIGHAFRHTLLVAGWMILRGALAILGYLLTVYHTPYLGPISNIEFWYSRTLALLTILPVALLIRLPSPRSPPVSCSSSVVLLRAGVVVVFGAAVGALLSSDGPSTKKTGLVLVDEYHSEWERTDKRLDTKWYGRDSGYNYSAIFDYLALAYDVRRLAEPCDGKSLADASVLVLKTPTRPYVASEIAAIRAFVEGGGGVFLIGDHTNVFGTSTHLNELSHVFGVLFRYDSILDTETDFHVLFERDPQQWHPVVDRVPEFFFATSCSLQSEWLPLGEAAILNRHLKSQCWTTDKNNFFPPVVNAADMDYGVVIQALARRVGRGRVVAFADSTTFSNFAAFLPGRREFFVDSIHWLDHSQWALFGRSWMVVLGAAVLAGLLLAALSLRDARVAACVLVLGAASFFGGQSMANAWRLAGYRHSRPSFARGEMLTFDAGLSTWELPIRGFTRDEGSSIQILSQWSLRLGCFYRVTECIADGSGGGQAMVVGDARRAPSAAEVRALRDHVQRGGNLLLLLRANQGGHWDAFLADLGVEVLGDGPRQGPVRLAERDALRWEVSPYLALRGGSPVLVNEAGEAAMVQVRAGRGLVLVCTLGQSLVDSQMGRTDSAVPDAKLRHRFSLAFGLLQSAAHGDPAAALQLHGDATMPLPEGETAAVK